MPVPLSCPRSECRNHSHPGQGWLVRYGFYHSRAHGEVQRYRCRGCRHTLSDQSESLHYYAKRRVCLQAVWLSLVGGSSLREIARRYHTSPQVVQNALLRLGRQAMAAQLRLLQALKAPSRVVYDGLRSCVSSQDYPCDLTALVEPEGETILTITHAVCRRSGRATEGQRRRMRRKNRVWRPPHQAMGSAIAMLHRELWAYLRPTPQRPAVIHTDENPLYRALLRADAVAGHYRRAGMLEHRRPPAKAPRSCANELFALNYVDRLLRHRLKEHTRESFAIARQATLQMHRAWIFAVDHNARRPYRVKHPEWGLHAEQAAVEPRVLKAVNRQFFSRRLRGCTTEIPESIRQVWTAGVPTPPLRWRVGQKGSSVRVPAYALRDLWAADQHAS